MSKELKAIQQQAAMRQAVWQANYADTLREPSDILTPEMRRLRIRHAQDSSAKWAEIARKDGE